MKRSILYFLWTSLLIISATSGRAVAQAFDYAHYPRMNFSVEHLVLDIEISPDELLIEGQTEYTLRANIANPDSVILQAAHMDIKGVDIGGEEAQFYLHNDTLVVMLSDRFEAGQELSLAISYLTSPRFGVHQNENGTIWTSLLPLSNRHWFPGVIHPRVSSSYRLNLTYPAGLTTYAAGERIQQKELNGGRQMASWMSARRLPSSQLWFAIGNFTSEQDKFGINSIDLTSEENLLADSTRSKLLKLAGNIIGNTEDELGFEYPYDELNIIVLGDHRWEEKAYAPGLVELYINRGNLEHQLMRGIYAQWFGTFIREEQWSDGDGFNLYQTALHYRMYEQPAPFEEQNRPEGVSRNPYATFSAERWTRWQKFYPSWDDTGFKEVLENSFATLLTGDDRVYGWNDFAHVWYKRSGQPRFDPLAPEESADTVSTDSILYRVDYQLDEAAGSLQLEFEARQDGVNELVTLPMIQYKESGTDTVEVTFTGRSDAIHLEVNPSVRNVDLDASRLPGLSLDQFKPASFLLYQLRNGNSVQQRKEAAENLGNHTENTDLQLAIADILKNESNQRIRAALLRSFSQITRGASGTEQVFLDELNAGSSRILKIALDALGNYQNNAKVARAVRETAMETDSLSIFKRAVDSYISVMSDSSGLIEFMEEVVKIDTVGSRSIYLINRLPEYGFTDRAIKQASFYLGSEYEYPVRKKALRFMFDYDQSGKRWSVRLENLLSDSDPRIRFMAVTHLPDIWEYLTSDPLKDKLLDEYDGRVYYEIKQVMERDR